jgi:hypothetical protein
MRFKIDPSAPWHRESYDRFLNERLPQLLAARLPLAGYAVDGEGSTECRVRVVLAAAGGDLEVEYPAIPQPDAEGVFQLGGAAHVVPRVAAPGSLAEAEAEAVGEQLFAFIEARLGTAPPGLPWDETLARAWLPLDAWVREFLQARAQRLDETNWLARRTHLRRLFRVQPEPIWTPEHWGRACPFEAPEGPNIGRILTLAVGAALRDGRVIRTDERPEAAVGLSASMAPLLEHNDLNRVLMGVNMMRQWLAPPDPEPALVQSGNEPDAPGFWCGRNLLTAFVSWGAENFEDSAVISASCAQRLNYPHPVEPGDKLSNRHGIKCVVTRILPDEEMPHLADGTPVEIAWSFMGLPSRMGFIGALREAILGRVARAEGQPAIAPPFHGPGEAELRERLARAALPEDGMEQLTLGRGGPLLERKSAVGWIYWGKLIHVAREKIRAWIDDAEEQVDSALPVAALQEAGAWENLREMLNTRAAARSDAGTLAARAAAGPLDQAPPPTPRFADLQRRLAAAGIHVELEGEKVGFAFADLEPLCSCSSSSSSSAVLRIEDEDEHEDEHDEGTVQTPPMLRLADPVPHPWLREREVRAVGAFEELPEYAALVEANARAGRVLAGQAPAGLAEKARADLEASVRTFFAGLLTPAHLQPGGGVLFSGQAVAAPGPELTLEQVGLPEELAWALFSAQVVCELGDEAAVRARDARATETLDRIMAGAWVLLTRYSPPQRLACLAFHPVRCPDRVIRIHPLICNPMNTDFDGDLIGVSLPLTEAARREAGERLSVAGTLAREPGLLSAFLPVHAPIWGLARLSLTPEGHRQIQELLGREVSMPEGFLTRDALAEAAGELLAEKGVRPTLEALEALTELGFEAAKASGASMNPFIGATMQRAPEPASDDPEAWRLYAEEFAERVAARVARGNFADEELDEQVLSIRSGARATLRQLIRTLGPWNVHAFPDGPRVTIRHGYRDGLTLEETRSIVRGHWEGLQGAVREWQRWETSQLSEGAAKGFSVLARAMRSEHPGMVFARAAATGERDPLTDPASRLFVGLPVGEQAGAEPRA